MKLTSHKAIAWLVLLAALAAPSSAWAHIQAGEVGGFVSGFHHPTQTLALWICPAPAFRPIMKPQFYRRQEKRCASI